MFLICLSAGAQPKTEKPRDLGVQVGEFKTEIRTIYTTSQGLPDDNVWSVAAGPNGVVYAGTAKGLTGFKEGKWHPVDEFQGDVKLLASDDRGLLFTRETSLYRQEEQGARLLARCPDEVTEPNALRCLAAGKRILVGTSMGLFELEQGDLVPVDGLNQLLGNEKEIRQIALGPDGRIAVAAQSGLIVGGQESRWKRVYPRSGKRSWAPYDVRGVTCDTRGRLWLASVQGAGCLDGDQWSLYTGYEGLPYNDFTTMAAGRQGVVWFGTRMGAIRYDGENWFYRRGLGWLPDDNVRSIAVTSSGDAWFATPKGVGLIRQRAITLAQKAKVFEDAIDKHHRRTPYGYVLSVGLKKPGDTSEWLQRDSDNDGLWTSMYGAGQCFAYAATKDPKAKQRARAAFEAVRFLSQVTQGGSHPAPPGFPARTILPATGEDPNKVYTRESDKAKQKRDPLWKVIVPRWPVSADGKWYWKCDTSSDELDGHYFLYAQYHDLVAETEEEKARVRDVILAITDHLIDHDFELIDHDGKPTRWARFGPKVLNGGLLWVERGLNSVSILSYLKVAEHVSGGGRKYREAYERLIKEHSYATNVLDPKLQNGPGSGNQSDDEMAFMCYYNLLKYEKDPALRKRYNISLRRYWALEEPEMCPLFNFIFAASYDGVRAWQAEDVGVSASRVPLSCLEEAVDTLKRYPLDRIRWGYRNSHRIDVVRLPDYIFDGRGRGRLRTGKVLPIDERFVEHWNHDPWRLDEAGDGRTLADGASFLLPYYMGRYHGFIIEKTVSRG
jgi:hypothetical protein